MCAFSFAVMADSHIRLEKGYHHTVYPSGLLANGRSRHVVKQINQLAPDLVIHLGDVVHPIQALSEHETSVQIARDLYQHLKSKLYIVPGNHDVGDKPKTWVPAPMVHEKSHETFEKHWGRSYLSFDHQACHFILLSSAVLNSGLRLETDQRKWLEQDLAHCQKAGKRLFLFTHYPLYLNHPQEEEHYDNIAQPARSWLLSLLKEYGVEAVFSGHSHHFFYNRHLDTDLYVAPSVGFVRPDFSELYHVHPGTEYGRNDVAKLGFFIVRVDETGHTVEFIRSHGQTDEQKDVIVTRSVSLSGRAVETRVSPVGLFLNHAWAQTIEMPYGNLDEFVRKSVRNDYALLALWDLGVRKLRVPISDLANDHTRERMRTLRKKGHEFTVFSAGVPTRQTKDLIAHYHDLVATWEVAAPRDHMPEAIRSIKAAKNSIGMRAFLSRIDSLADQRREKASRFTHLGSHGFKLEDLDLLSTLVKRDGAAEAIDGFVFRLTPDTSLWQGIRLARQCAADLNAAAAVHVQMPRESQGVIFSQDREIGNRVAETLAAALAATDVEVFLDTFVDHDRGYYPRHGLLDRRYNPRSSYYVLLHLYLALNGVRCDLEMVCIECSTGTRAFSLKSPQDYCILLLSDKEVERVELDLAGIDPFRDRNATGKWMDLGTGRVTDVSWQGSALGGGRIVLDTPSLLSDPALLILRGPQFRKEVL